MMIEYKLIRRPNRLNIIPTGGTGIRQQRRRRRIQRHCLLLLVSLLSQIYITFVHHVPIALLVLLSSSLSLSIYSRVSCKEIVAKVDEWTLIGENDTVDAGMNIRIDMTTGEKWVKQISSSIDDDDDDNNNNNNDKSKQKENNMNIKTTDTSSSAVIAIPSDDDSGNKETLSNKQQRKETTLNINGESSSSFGNNILPKIIYNDENDNSRNEGTTGTQHKQQQEDLLPKYDYDMMYRTLSKLPIEEQERIQLPKEYIPSIDNDDDDSTILVQDDHQQYYYYYKNENDTSSPIIYNIQQLKQKRIEFETQLRYIWEQRQKELQELEIADLPQILKEYINDIQLYINQQQHLFDNSTDDITNTTSSTMNTMNTTNTTTNTTIIITHDHIISILQELEYQLQDIDLTRDFHTLDGWKLLVSLLVSSSLNNNSIHQHDPDTNTNATSQVEFQQQQILLLRKIYEKHEIQMYTSWVIGTALKHIHEFHTYAIEPITVPIIYTNNHHNTDQTTTIDLVLEQIIDSYQEYNGRYANTARNDDNINTSFNNNIDMTNNDTNVDVDYNSKIITILRTKLLRLIYCYGSLMRGNYHAQYYSLVQQQQLQVSSTSISIIPTLLDQLITSVILPSIHELLTYHVSSSTLTNNNSTSSSQQLLQQHQQTHIEFLNKFVQRILNVISDCLTDVSIGVQQNDIYDQRNTNVEQLQQLQQIYNGWQNILCHTSDDNNSKNNSVNKLTDQSRLLLYNNHTNNSSSFMSLLLLSTSSDSIPEDIRVTIHSILSHCPAAY